MTVYTTIDAVFEKLQLDKNQDISKADIEESIEQGYLNLNHLKTAKHKLIGFGLVHAAITAGNTEVADYLIDMLVDVNVKSNTNTTALHQACYLGVKSLILKLILAGADVKAINNKGVTPLDDLKESTQLNEDEKKVLFKNIFAKLLDDEIKAIKNEVLNSSHFYIDHKGNLHYRIGFKEVTIDANQMLERFKTRVPKEFGTNENLQLGIAASMYKFNPALHQVENLKVKPLPQDRILPYDEWLKLKYNIIAKSERNSLTKTNESGINYIFQDNSTNEMLTFAMQFCRESKQAVNMKQYDNIYNKIAVLLEGKDNEKVQMEYQKYLDEMKLKIPRTKEEIQDQLKLVEQAQKTIALIDAIDLSMDFSSPVAKFRQVKSTQSRLDEFRGLAIDNKEGYYSFKATSAYKLSLEAFLALNQDTVSPSTAKTLKEASLLLMGDNGDITSGLKADANWLSYLDVHRYEQGTASQRVQFINQAIVQDVHDLLNGNPVRQSIDKHVPVYQYGDIAKDLVTNMKFVGKGSSRYISRFFPDESGNSETDSVMIQAGGMAGHSTMIKIWKQGVDINGSKVKEGQKPHHYKFYRTEYNAGRRYQRCRF